MLAAEPLPESFNRVLCVCVGGLDLEKLIKAQLISSVPYFRLGGKAPVVTGLVSCDDY